MKQLFLLSLLGITLIAQERPKIALVLSGGGARGGAHVGVLKVLEKNRIPIDMIIGTSMGSFIGGLYASGKTPQKIEDMLSQTDWKKYIRTDFYRPDTSMRKKEIEYIYQGRIGFGIDAQDKLVLPTGVLKRQPLLFKFLEETQDVENIHDFDKLSIPFRAIATDIRNADAVVLSSASLARAMYASSSIPGGLQPIRINKKDLVDGGVSQNIPIETAREMGADIIIAVDVSEGFANKIDVNSYLVVMGQLVNILMRKNADRSIEKLTQQDILITPDLNGYTGLDADKYPQIIKKGSEAFSTQLINKLQKFSLDKREYAQYCKKYRKKPITHPVKIDAIEIQNPTYLSDDAIRSRLHLKVGDLLDEAELRKDLLHIYNLMVFDSVEYKVIEKEGKNTLLIITEPSWDNHGEIRLALGLEDDFMGHSSYSFKFGYTKFGLTSLGGEWKNDFEIGKRKMARSELFLPFDSMQRYYFRPNVVFKNWIDLIPAKYYNLANDGTFELELERYGGGMAFGVHVTTDYEFEVGLSRFHDSLEMKTLGFRESYEAIPLYISFRSDNLDNLNFPNFGAKTKVVWTKEMNSWGSEYNYEQLFFDLEKAYTFGYHNITGYFKYGTTYENQITAVVGSFNLGGLFNLSGYVPYSLNNDNMGLGVFKYRYELKDGGFFGTLNTPIYVGMSAEIGNTWKKGEDLSYNMMKKSATVYLAADTLFGPFYLAYGISDEGESSGYLYLGEKF